MEQLVIVGAGHAGGVAAATLRQYGYAGAVTVVGDEPLAPYQRPPLSKAWLKGEVGGEDLALRPAAFYADRAIDLRLGVEALEIDRDARRVRLSDGETLAYDGLILATGARPILPPFARAPLAGVMTLRSAADAERLKTALGPGRRLAVIGGGYIGLEVAASARALGAEVVVLEREDRLLARVAAPAVSRFFQAYHQQQGVAFELGSSVVALASVGGHVRGVVLADGRELACDVVVVGVGARPNQDLALAAGLACDDGVVVDLDARTSDRRVFAIGDVTRRPMPLYERMLRLESVPNALEQAKQAACAVTGRPRPTAETPWQWSDQYDLKLQIAGYPLDVDRVVLRGDPEAAKFAVFHLRGDLVQAVEAINAPAEFMAGRQLIGQRRLVDLTRLADPGFSMKEVARPLEASAGA